MKKRLPIIIFLTILLFSISFSAHAQTISILTVAPSRQELTVNPGETTAINIKFLNQTNNPISGVLRAVDFIVQDKEGTPTFLESPTQISPRFSAASWVTLPYDRMTIAPKDKVLINARIQVPADARPGGRYFAVYFEPGGIVPGRSGAPQEAGTGVAGRIAGLVYLRISGPISEGALVTQFLAPRFSQYGPITITTEILNRGDYHIRPKGVVTVTGFLGRLIDQSLLEEQNIFPDAARAYENMLGGKWMFGRHKANLEAIYGDTGKVLTAAVYFWIFPWKETTVVVLTLIIIALLVVSLRRRTKEREKEITAELKEKEKELKKLKEELKKRESE